MKMGDLIKRAGIAAAGRTAMPPSFPVAKGSSPPATPPPWGPPPLGLKWIVLEAKILDGEHVLVVFEKRWLKEARAKHPGKVIYFPPEVDELAHFKDDPEAFKALHRIKKEFGAWIVPQSSPEAVAFQKGGKRYERRRTGS